MKKTIYTFAILMQFLSVNSIANEVKQVGSPFNNPKVQEVIWKEISKKYELEGGIRSKKEIAVEMALKVSYEIIRDKYRKILNNKDKAQKNNKFELDLETMLIFF